MFVPMTVVAVSNQKGGVGKTTVTLGLADAAVRRGEPVLVVDLDPQANATTGLGLSRPPRTVDDALAADRTGGLADVLVDAAWTYSEGSTPQVAPASPALAAREPQLATDPIGAQDRLRTALAGAVEGDRCGVQVAAQDLRQRQGSRRHGLVGSRFDAGFAGIALRLRGSVVVNEVRQISHGGEDLLIDLRIFADRNAVAFFECHRELEGVDRIEAQPLDE